MRVVALVLCLRLVDRLEDGNIIVVTLVKISRFVRVSSCDKVRKRTAVVVAELSSSGVAEDAPLLEMKVAVEVVVGD